MTNSEYPRVVSEWSTSGAECRVLTERDGLLYFLRREWIGERADVHRDISVLCARIASLESQLSTARTEKARLEGERDALAALPPISTITGPRPDRETLAPKLREAAFPHALRDWYQLTPHERGDWLASADVALSLIPIASEVERDRKALDEIVKARTEWLFGGSDNRHNYDTQTWKYLDDVYLALQSAERLEAK